MSVKNKITVVTVCYNAEKDIEKTMVSLLKQTYRPLQYIIVDGASTDKTLDIIEDYREQFLTKDIDLIVISEPDKGIYDAMNKGVSLASGQWINFMNAGDGFHQDSSIDEVFANDVADYDVVYGDFMVIYNKKYTKIRNCIDDTSDYKFLLNLSHQGTFIKTDVHRKYLFDLKYKISADFNALLKMYLDNKLFKKVSVLVCDYDGNGISTTNSVGTFKDRCAIERANGLPVDEKYEKAEIRRRKMKNMIKRFLPSFISMKIRYKKFK